jgi:hypothetical protein
LIACTIASHHSLYDGHFWFNEVSLHTYYVLHWLYGIVEGGSWNKVFVLYGFHPPLLVVRRKYISKPPKHESRIPSVELTVQNDLTNTNQQKPEKKRKADKETETEHSKHIKITNKPITKAGKRKIESQKRKPKH